MGLLGKTDNALSQFLFYPFVIIHFFAKIWKLFCPPKSLRHLF
ncbi:hypothetical protein HMPREF9442_01386 [Paraprevotella xylaniphila YIT 11841]|uniref:Uncharacterized protein n=1 Tax=Paraprevotella xylaniphila YIT 11841 TaxID=762982 RepID=F3QT69_9BACT|nr:hypothetical protein HMPREF9442_01386 [Paraprevotella xylaniphila YIT 11841]